MEIGTIISCEGSPNSSEFLFNIDKPAVKVVKKGQFVQTKNEFGWVISRIEEIYRSNKYFENVEIVEEVKNAMPTKEWESVIAKAKTLGIKANGIERNKSSPSPGARVSLCDKEILKEFFGFDENGLYLGDIDSHELPVKINMTKLLQKHFAVLALSGAGKSYLIKVILEELLDRDKSKGQIAPIIFDTHGEYIAFDTDKQYASKTQVFKSSDIRIGLSDISMSTLYHLLPDLSPAQKRELNKILKDMKSENDVFDLEDLERNIENNVRSSAKYVLLDIIHEMKSLHIFGKSDYPSANSICKQGILSVIDLSDCTSQRKRQIIVYYLCKKLFETRQKGKIPPFLTIIEEAHNYAPERVAKYNAVSKGIIEKIAREGRKFGACLALISQRPVHLATTALSQCNTHIILRITNPYDIDHIGKSSEGLSSDVLKSLPGLHIGEAIITGEAANQPICFKVRQKKVQDSPIANELEKACIEYSEMEKNNKKDLDAFR